MNEMKAATAIAHPEDSFPIWQPRAVKGVVGSVVVRRLAGFVN
jgi:hypothetical protein